MEISKAKIARYSLLRHKKYRDREGLFIVQGEKAVKDTLPFFECVDLIHDKEAIRKISTLDNLPDVIAVCRIPGSDRMDEEAEAKSLVCGNDSFILVLDGVQDPGNLGTIVRTAHWFGIRQIFCSPDTVDIYNPKVVMSTMGSIAKVSVKYCNLATLFNANPEIPVYGLLLDGSDIFDLPALPPGFIVMGSEGHGPSAETAGRITMPITIPPADAGNHPDSLNVAIATAITLSQLIK